MPVAYIRRKKPTRVASPPRKYGPYVKIRNGILSKGVLMKLKAFLSSKKKTRFILMTVACSMISFAIYFFFFIPTPEEFISSTLGFHPEWHPLHRSERFPSVEERVKLYMSNYYILPCVGKMSHASERIGFIDERFEYFYDYSDSYSSARSQYPKVKLSTFDGQYAYTFPTTVDPDTPFVLWEEAMYPRKRNHIRNYFFDGRKIISLVQDLTGRKRFDEIPPIIAQFGDYESIVPDHVPSIHKFRKSSTKISLDSVTNNEENDVRCSERNDPYRQVRKKLVTISQKSDVAEVFSPIIWLFNYDRHFGLVPSIRRVDTTWEGKINKAIWRGVPTGLLSIEDKDRPFEERCDLTSRCRFVRDNIHVSPLDIGFSKDLKGIFEIDKDHRFMIKGMTPIRHLLRHKAIIIMEGNDISSGLKWALYSRSVVMMPAPTKTSFAMEELLVPWTHYVPLQDDMSDVSEKMQWILDHDEEARKIAERATLFMHDMLFHEDAEEENRQIQMEILKRYMNFFVAKSSLQ